MPEHISSVNFHFIRPLWLLAIIPALAVIWMLWKRQNVQQQYKGIIAEHLLPFLVIRTQVRTRIRPYQMLTVLCLLGIIALSGPTWMREPLPFAEDEAPLVIAMDLSKSMDEVDIEPSRLKRAQQKVCDLLSLRKGGRTALVAYAGSAHTVLPFTDDQQILETYVKSLDSTIMPLSGKDVQRALELANKMLSDEVVTGTILFLTDGIEKEYTKSFVEHKSKNKHMIAILAIGEQGNESFDAEGIKESAKKAGAYTTSVTVNDSDVRRINARIKTHMKLMQDEDNTRRWRDFGYWFVFPVMFVALFWFRKGWTIQWGK